MEKGYYFDNLHFLVRLSKENKDGLNWMVSSPSSSSLSPSWSSSSLMYGGEWSGSGCDPCTSRQMWSQLYLPVKQVPEHLLQDAWRFADPVCVWWPCSCRHGTTAKGRVVFRCTHWAFPYCVGVKLKEVKQVNRKWNWGRNFCRLFRDYVRCHFKDTFIFHFHLSALHLCWKFCHVCTATWYLIPGFYREMLLTTCRISVLQQKFDSTNVHSLEILEFSSRLRKFISVPFHANGINTILCVHPVLKL